MSKTIEETPKYQDEIQGIMDECLPKTVIDDGYYQMTIAKISSVVTQSNSQLLDRLVREIDKFYWASEDDATQEDRLRIIEHNHCLDEVYDLINNLKKGL